MKTIALLLLAFTGYAQNLSLTHDMSIGQNCGQGQPAQTITYQEVNLNGYTLTLRNVNLVITGNLNGPGKIESCGNPNQTNSTLCVNGFIQNGAITMGLNCTLSEPIFEFTNNYCGINYIVYDISGKELLRGVTDESTYNNLPKHQVLIFKPENYKAIKLFKN